MLSRILFLLLCSCAVDRLASVPPFDHVADVGKVLDIKSDGSGLQWSVAGGVTGALSSSGSVTNNNLASWAGTTGTFLKDSGVPSANVVLVSRTVTAGTGLAGGGALSSDIAIGMSTIGAYSVLGASGATGFPSAIGAATGNKFLQSTNAATPTLKWDSILLSSVGVTGQLAIGNGGTNSATAGSGFQNLSPQTTKGDLVSFATAPVRQAVGASGSVLTAYPGQSSGIGWSTSTTTIWGTQTNDNATAGYVGETLNCSRAQGGTGFTSGTPGNICSTGGNSITLTPGDWQVSGACGFLPGGSTSITVMDCAVSKTSATLPSAATLADPSAGEIWMTHRQAASVNGNYITFSIPSFRVSVSASTPLYLVAGATFTVSTMSGYGYLEARRMR